MATDRWQIGDVSITRVIEANNKRLPTFVFRNLTPEEVIGQDWLRPHFATDDGHLFSVVQAFIIDCGSERIVVDTCIGNDKIRRNEAWNQLDGPFLRDLEAAGYPPDSIDTVLCTHLHIDHVGWNTRLVDGQWVPTFPNARYLFGRREFEHWSQETTEEMRGDVAPQIAEEVIDAQATQQDSVRPIIDAGLHELVDMDHRVNDMVSLEPTPGHTPGHLSVRISSGGQEAVITGDLMHHPVQCAMPHVASNFDHDVGHARATRTDFLRRYADRPVLVFGTHFAAPTAGRVVSHGDSWRFDVSEPN